MHKITLKSKIFLVAFIPTSIVAFLLAGYFTWQRFHNLDAGLQQQGFSTIHQLTPASKYGLMSNNYKLLQDLANNASEDPGIVAVSIYDRAGNLVAFMGPDKLMFKKLRKFVNLQTKNKNCINFTLPITYQSVNKDMLPTTATPAKPPQAGALIGWISVNLSLAPIHLAKFKTGLIAALILLFGLIVAWLLAFLLGRSIIVPILNLRDKLNKINRGQAAKTPELDTNILELTLIDAALMQLTNKLNQLQNEFRENVEQTTADIRQTLETLEIQNIELDLAYKDVKKRSRKKSEFIASLSHEIRTPMSSIIGFTKLLLDSDLSSFQKDYLQTIQKSANTLLSIINDILDLSKIEAGKLKLENIPMNITECVEEVLTLLAPIAHEKQLELVALPHDDLPNNVLGDQLRLKQILINLINNAIKFTETGGIIISITPLKSKDGHTTIQISVADTGIGLSSEEQKKLFHAFGQATIATARKFGGTGLGLVISRKLIEQMGGDITLESQPGDGTTIRFTLVVKQLADIPDNKRHLEQLKNKTFLIFDPHPLACQAIQKIIAKNGIQTIVADSKDDFLNKLQTDKVAKKPDCIIIGSNHVVEKIDFYKSLITTAKQSSNNPILFLANTSNQNILHELANLGIASCITKPINQKKLKLEIKRFFIQSDLTQTSSKPQTQSSPMNISATKHRILVAEDNATSLKLMTSLLAQRNANITTATNGKQALDFAKQYSYDLILLDMQMPIISGLETSQRIRKDSQQNKDTPIIVISAHIEEEKEKLIAHGINEYLIKPINMEQLRYIIDKWINHKGAQAMMHNDTKPNAQVFDWQRMIELTGGQEEIAKEMLGLFIEDLTNLQQEIEQSYAKKAYTELKDTLHKLAGACSYCGIGVLTAVARAFEKAVDDAQTATYAQHMQELNQAVVSLQIAIAQENILA